MRIPSSRLVRGSCRAGLVVAVLLAPVVVVSACRHPKDDGSGGGSKGAPTAATSTMPPGGAINGAAAGSTVGATATLPGGARSRDASVDGAAGASLDSGGVDDGASASASTSSSAVLAEPGSIAVTLSERIIGLWTFSRFDLNDPGTKGRWDAVPEDLKKEVLEAAPEATLEITKDAFITRLLGVPERKSVFTIEAALLTTSDAGVVAPDGALPPFDTVTLDTIDAGRKRVWLVDGDTIRVEELDRKESFVTFFTRKKSDPAPVVSGTPKGP